MNIKYLAIKRYATALRRPLLVAIALVLCFVTSVGLVFGQGRLKLFRSAPDSLSIQPSKSVIVPVVHPAAKPSDLPEPSTLPIGISAAHATTTPDVSLMGVVHESPKPVLATTTPSPANPKGAATTASPASVNDEPSIPTFARPVPSPTPSKPDITPHLTLSENTVTVKQGESSKVISARSTDGSLFEGIWSIDVPTGLYIGDSGKPPIQASTVQDFIIYTNSGNSGFDGLNPGTYVFHVSGRADAGNRDQVLLAPITVIVQPGFVRHVTLSSDNYLGTIFTIKANYIPKDGFVIYYNVDSLVGYCFNGYFSTPVSCSGNITVATTTMDTKIDIPAQIPMAITLAELGANVNISVDDGMQMASWKMTTSMCHNYGAAPQSPLVNLFIVPDRTRSNSIICTADPYAS